MDNKVRIKIADSNHEQFAPTMINDIIMYSTLSNQGFHIGIANTSNFISFKNNKTNIYNPIEILQDMKVYGNIYDVNGNPYTAGSLSSNSISTAYIEDKAITSEKIQDNTIDSRLLQDRSVTNYKIALNTIQLENLDSMLLSASNILPGQFSNSPFSFQNNVGINRWPPTCALDIIGGAFIGNTLRDKYAKINENGNPYILDIIHDDYDGRGIKFINNICTRGNTEDSTYATISFMTPNLEDDKFKRIQFGKSSSRCFEIDFTPSNTNDLVSMKVLKNGTTSSHLYITENGIGINNANPNHALDITGDVNIEGNLQFTGAHIEVQGNVLDFNNSNITMKPGSNFNIQVRDYLDVRNSECNVIIRGTNNQYLGIATSNPKATLHVAGNTIIDGSISTSNNINTNLINCKGINITNGNIICSNNSFNITGYASSNSLIHAQPINIITPLANYDGVIRSSLTSSHETSWTHFVATVDNNAVFQVARDGIVLAPKIFVDSNIGIGISDPKEKLEIDGNIKISGVFYGNGIGISNINANNITSGTIPHFYLDDIPASRITSATMLADRIFAGTFGVANGNNLINLNATNINGVLKNTVTFDTGITFKSKDNVNRFLYENNGSTHLYSGCNLLLNSSNIFFNGGNINITSNHTLSAPNIKAGYLYGDGNNITNIKASELTGDLGSQFRFPTNFWIKSLDEENRFMLNSNTYISAPNRIVLGSTESIYTESNQLYIQTDYQDMTCLTATNMAINQNLSDKENELKGTLSLKHPNNTNAVLRAITISRQDEVTAYITAVGNYYGDSSYFTSDDRIKTEKTDIVNATDTIMKLHPQEYQKWSSINRTSDDISVKESGLIAQEVYNNVPELRHLVMLPEDSKPDENDWGGKLHLNYTGFIAYLIKAIQELKEEINVIKTTSK
jgi:hypothetical protein